VVRAVLALISYWHLNFLKCFESLALSSDWHLNILKNFEPLALTSDWQAQSRDQTLESHWFINSTQLIKKQNKNNGSE